MKRTNLHFFLCTIFILFFSIQISGQSISGRVTDKETGEYLIGSNVFLEGTAIGAASDYDGNYSINNIKPGKYNLKASFIGYQPQVKEITVVAGKKLVVDFSLEIESLEGDEVIVTAQALGQKQAINQQLTSNTIKNVVSSARIQEVPDANAAESVGRLPGISVQRSGGEGNKVVIRGLEPKYNAIMVNGVRLSSTNPNDQSVDVSMISPYMLDGIEVTKNVLPDQDADALGGSVNFKIKSADEDYQDGNLGYNFLAQSSYNGLPNAEDEFNNYKFVGSAEGRFFDGNLGVFLQGDYERKNLSSNEMGLGVQNFNATDRTKYLISGLNLMNIKRDRERFNATISLDYKIPDGRILFTNMYSTGETETIQRNESYNIIGNQHSHIFAKSTPETIILSNSMSYEQTVGQFDIDFGLSHTFSETNDPSDWTLQFLERNAFEDIRQYRNVDGLDPRDIPGGAVNNLDNTDVEFLTTNSNSYLDRAYAGNFDIKRRFDFSNMFTAEFKVGGKFRYQKRTNDVTTYNGAGFSLQSAGGIRDYITENFGGIGIRNFLDEDYELGEFLEGQYDLTAAVDEQAVSDLADLLNNNIDEIDRRGARITYAKNQYRSKTNDYEGTENYYAFYGMATFDLGKKLNLITGLRVQDLKTEYTGAQGINQVQEEEPYNHYDTTVTKNHNHLLPSAILKYQPFDWFDLRLAYTNTLSYPEFQAIYPRIAESSVNNTIFYNNANLKAIESRNLDVYMSFYNNTIGLFTIGFFKKKIENQIYLYEFFANKDQAVDYYPPGLINPDVPIKIGYNVTTFINNENEVDLWGIEVDWQTHFWYLPAPFNGMVLNVNYTHTESETKYPFFTQVTRFPPTYETKYFKDRLISQPNDLFNISLGYDYKDFSIRASLLYQDNIFSTVDFWPQLRGTTDAYTKVDVSIKQKLPWYNIQLIGLLNNITDEKDSQISQLHRNIPFSQETYGMSATFGVRVSL